MRVFVTGATGFIGSAIVKELLSAGHSVLGLARSDASAARLRDLGAEAHLGELSDVDSLAAGAAQCDGVIHAAFIHEFDAYAEAAQTDRAAVNAFVGALRGSGKPFVATSVTVLLQAGRLGSETDPLPADNPLDLRAASERAVLACADHGVRASVVRLPPSVHGEGDHAFVPALIAKAREKGFVGFIGDGGNRWPAVHRFDAARLFRLALESAPAGSVLHAVAEEGIAMRTLADTIGKGLGLPVRRVEPSDAQAHFGWLSMFVGLDNPTSSDKTRQALNWQPRERGLLQDVEEGGYLD